MALNIYNTLTRKKEEFKSIKNKQVGLYTCGPTVYWFAHIGNLRTYLFEDILKRVLKYDGYKIKHVMNITDVGHLTSDADIGEDKMEKGAKREGKTAWQIAKFYTNAFKKDIKNLNIESPTLWTKATDYIKEQIDLIKKLEKKGFTYKTLDGIYFNTSKIKDYGKLSGVKKRKLKAGARVKMVMGKKNPTDFALWKFTQKGIKRQMEWVSPWGKGFPGWHTECVVMSAKHLGVPFDIHCGGIDHIPIHHTNEIAQAEAAFNKNLANFWLHGEFLTLEGGKMAKSEGNIITLESLIKKEFNPLSYRYLCLSGHYRSKISFSWEALKSAQNALDNLYEKIRGLNKSENKKSGLLKDYIKKFSEYINDDLNTPKAIALMWETIKSKELLGLEKYNILINFDKVLGLGLSKIKKSEIPQEIIKIVEEREKYRKENNWKKSDELREKIKSLGFIVEDTAKGPKIKK